MSSGDFNTRRGSTHLGAQHVVEEMAELIRDLRALLESYAPMWYTEDMDTRVSETLAMFTQTRIPSQDPQH